VSTTAALTGWIAAGVIAALALVVRRTQLHGHEAVARACHELRGPLTAARLGLALPLGADDGGAARLRAIDAELCRAALALDDLAAARAGREERGPGPRELRRVEVAALIEDAVRAAQGRAGDSVASVTVVAPRAGAVLGRSAPAAWVWGEPMRLVQALSNLIANAIEHGGPEVTIHTVTRAWAVRIEVRDGGPGLPAPVAQLARRARRGRGRRGRGLAIALEVARRHGGTVAAAPTRAGARVVLELPAGAAAPRRRVR
jgi:signal transduction histidine kinase